MKKPFSFLFLVISLAVSSGVRASIEKDLGSGLAYFRVTDPVADARSAIAAIDSKSSLVLDLRSLPDAADLANPLSAALVSASSKPGLRIVLINPGTAPALIAAVSRSLPTVITIGPVSPALSPVDGPALSQVEGPALSKVDGPALSQVEGPALSTVEGTALTPDVAVKISTDDDRRAYTALANGTPIETLLNATQEKRRYDEAKLMHDHINGITPRDEPDADDDNATDSPPSDKPKSATAEKKTEPPPLIDRVLQRAIQLHRALFALKKLS